MPPFFIFMIVVGTAEDRQGAAAGLPLVPSLLSMIFAMPRRPMSRHKLAGAR